MLIPLYQPLGSSTHKLAEKLGNTIADITTHTGTLDPMAEGVIVCLTGQDRFKKGSLNWKKVYQFQILAGIQTDSHDCLGKITDMNFDFPANLPELINSELKNFKKTFQQKRPMFSAARKANTKQEVTLTEFQISNFKCQKSELLKNIIKNRIELVVGDFRQQEVLKQWKDIELPKELQLITCQVTVSKRFYIRQLVADLSEKLEIPLTTFHIIRPQEGPYKVKDCTCLV